MQIAAELGLTKSTVAYHARRIGLPAQEGPARRYDWREIQSAHDSGLSPRDCARRFGFTTSSWQQAVQRGDLTARPAEMPLERLLQKGVRRGRRHLKARLLKSGTKENRCEVCGLTDWLGKPLSMQLHHRNGDGLDNRLENLQLLCANCHAQTDTWGGKGQRQLRPQRVKGKDAA